jgi:hypothetical protein
MFTKIIYVSLRSQRREEHEKTELQRKSYALNKVPKLAIKLDLIEKFKSF